MSARAPSTSARWRAAAAGLLAALTLGSTAPSVAQLPAPSPGDNTVVQAREALRRGDRNALMAARDALQQQRHPLAMWADYWELGNRLATAQQPELDAFYARWPNTYVEDRLRNDWLLELGRRRDWAGVRAEFPRFRMNDDREVTCHVLLARHLEGQDVRQPALATWQAQRELEPGCTLLAATLLEARVFTDDDIWARVHAAAEQGRLRSVRTAAALLGKPTEKAVVEIVERPDRYLKQRNAGAGRQGHPLLMLALMRLAVEDPDEAAKRLEASTTARLSAAQEAFVWAQIARQAGLKLQSAAAIHAQHAWKLWDRANKPGVQPAWSEDVLAWHVRAALRQPASDKQRWALVQRAIEAMPPAEQRQEAWVYWKAQADLARAPAGPEGEAARTAARSALAGLASPFSFYGQLANEDLGQPLRLPPAPQALSAAERDVVRGNPGLQRALQLLALGLRSEGTREWNYTLRGLPDRELLAAAQWACEREVWDRCIHASERARSEFDVQHRYPLAFRDMVQERARGAGLDPALVLGLIRQESRFVIDARSGVGASGLMQLMPDTARWTARKLGLPWQAGYINDTSLNLQLGSFYLKRVLDDLDGSLAMAAAAYNAGPGRPRRWREAGGTHDAAIWAETIPFNETRDYVKKVLSNSVAYAAAHAQLLGGRVPTLRERLGKPIGPRGPAAAAPDRDLP